MQEQYSHYSDSYGQSDELEESESNKASLINNQQDIIPDNIFSYQLNQQIDNLSKELQKESLMHHCVGSEPANQKAKVSKWKPVYELERQQMFLNEPYLINELKFTKSAHDPNFDFSVNIQKTQLGILKDAHNYAMTPYLNMSPENTHNMFNSLLMEEIKGKDEELKFELVSNNLKLEQKLTSIMLQLSKSLNETIEKEVPDFIYQFKLQQKRIENEVRDQVKQAVQQLVYDVKTSIIQFELSKEHINKKVDLLSKQTLQIIAFQKEITKCFAQFSLPQESLSNQQLEDQLNSFSQSQDKKFSLNNKKKGLVMQTLEQVLIFNNQLKGQLIELTKQNQNMEEMYQQKNKEQEQRLNKELQKLQVLIDDQQALTSDLKNQKRKQEQILQKLEVDLKQKNEKCDYLIKENEKLRIQVKEQELMYQSLNEQKDEIIEQLHKQIAQIQSISPKKLLK